MVVEVYTLRAPNPQAKEGSIDWFGRAACGTLRTSMQWRWRCEVDDATTDMEFLASHDWTGRRRTTRSAIEMHENLSSLYTVRTSMHDLSTTALYITFAMFIRKARAGPPGETRPVRTILN